MKRRWTDAALLLCVALLIACDSHTTAPAAPRFDLRPSGSSAAGENRGFAVGQVTPTGGWRYDWDNTKQQWGRLDIVEPRRWLNDIACSDRPQPADCGGFTGRSGQRRAFVHIYLAEERTRATSRPVLLFAWGDDELFEAVVLADTPDNRDIFRSSFATGDVEVAIAAVRTVAETADDVIRGRTRLSNYYGELNFPRP